MTEPQNTSHTSADVHFFFTKHKGEESVYKHCWCISLHFTQMFVDYFHFRKLRDENPQELASDRTWKYGPNTGNYCLWCHIHTYHPNLYLDEAEKNHWGSLLSLCRMCSPMGTDSQLSVKPFASPELPYEPFHLHLPPETHLMPVCHPSHPWKLDCPCTPRLHCITIWQGSSSVMISVISRSDYLRSTPTTSVHFPLSLPISFHWTSFLCIGPQTHSLLYLCM